METSQDIFYLVLAFCVLWLTVFLCWALYYLIRLLKQSNEVLTGFRERLGKIGSVFSFFRGKLLAKGLEGLVSLAKAKISKKVNSKNKN